MAISDNTFYIKIPLDDFLWKYFKIFSLLRVLLDIGQRYSLVVNYVTN